METICVAGGCPFSQISWLWYAAAVVLSSGLGCLWYGKLFTRKWVEAVRFECPCGADLAKGEKCTCKGSSALGIFAFQLMATALLALMYFVLTPISIWLSVLVVVAVCGWMKVTLRFQIQDCKRWITLCAIDVGYFFVVSTIMVIFALI